MPGDSSADFQGESEYVLYQYYIACHRINRMLACSFSLDSESQKREIDWVRQNELLNSHDLLRTRHWEKN